jgi:hypothetical protein
MEATCQSHCAHRRREGAQMMCGSRALQCRGGDRTQRSISKDLKNDKDVSHSPHSALDDMEHPHGQRGDEGLNHSALSKGFLMLRRSQRRTQSEMIMGRTRNSMTRPAQGEFVTLLMRQASDSASFSESQIEVQSTSKHAKNMAGVPHAQAAAAVTVGKRKPFFGLRALDWVCLSLLAMSCECSRVSLPKACVIR